MKVWKMIFLFKQAIFRFHVNFPGCKWFGNLLVLFVWKDFSKHRQSFIQLSDQTPTFHNLRSQKCPRNVAQKKKKKNKKKKKKNNNNNNYYYHYHHHYYWPFTITVNQYSSVGHKLWIRNMFFIDHQSLLVGSCRCNAKTWDLWLILHYNVDKYIFDTHPYTTIYKYMISSKSSQIHLFIFCAITQRVRSCLQYRCCCKLGNAWACFRNSMCSKTAWAWCILVFCRAGWKTNIHERCHAIMLFIQRPRGVKTIKSDRNKHFETISRWTPGFRWDIIGRSQVLHWMNPRNLAPKSIHLDSYINTCIQGNGL